MEAVEGAVAGEYHYPDTFDRARFNMFPCYVDTVAGSVERTIVTKMAAVEEVDVVDVEEEGMVVIMEAMVVMAEVAEEVVDGEGHQVVNNYTMTEPGQDCLIITTLQYLGSGRGGGSDDWWGN